VFYLLMRCLIRRLPLLCFGFLPSPAEGSYLVSYEQHTYIGGHPTSTCNYVARRIFKNPAQDLQFVFVRSCSRDNRFQEQQLSDVRVLARGNVLHIPKQSILGGAPFPGLYWCKYTPDLSRYRSASCGKDGWNFGYRLSP